MNPKPGTDIEDLVRARAHKIWIEEGQPEGRSEAHWQRAQDEFQRELAAAKPHPEIAASLSEPSASPDAGVSAQPDLGVTATPDPGKSAKPDKGVTASPAAKVKSAAAPRKGPAKKG
ncbi:hypothetical protein BH10PSE7_BH10PSE7_41960 [soil metagenome]